MLRAYKNMLHISNIRFHMSIGLQSILSIIKEANHGSSKVTDNMLEISTRDINLSLLLDDVMNTLVMHISIEKCVCVVISNIRYSMYGRLISGLCTKPKQTGFTY
jgi:hypothetical protein